MSLPGQISNLARLPSPSSSAFGDVDGPSSATNNAVAVFNGTTGKIIKNSTTIADATGINGTVGATTPAAGSFTTLTGASTATLGASGGSVGRVILDGPGTTGNMPYVQLKSGGTSQGIWGFSGAALGTAATDFAIFAETGKTINLWANGQATIGAQVNSTGLAVTGTLGASGNISNGTFGGDPSSGTADGATYFAVGQITASANGIPTMQLRRRSSDGTTVSFWRDTTQVGSISVTTTSTAYNTSSDARLKTNIRNLTGSGAIIDALQPRVFDWKSGDSPDTYGFIAQEAYKVFPQSVTKGDDDPDTITQQWAMDSAKLVPVLVAEIKALRARVAKLES